MKQISKYNKGQIGNKQQIHGINSFENHIQNNHFFKKTHENGNRPGTEDSICTLQVQPDPRRHAGCTRGFFNTTSTRPLSSLHESSTRTTTSGSRGPAAPACALRSPPCPFCCPLVAQRHPCCLHVYAVATRCDELVRETVCTCTRPWPRSNIAPLLREWPCWHTASHLCA